MIKFSWQDSKLEYKCQNMKCSKPLVKHSWSWSWNGEDFCSYECRLARVKAWKLRAMYFDDHGFLRRNWPQIGRTLVYRLNGWLNPLEWLKRW